MNNYYVWEFKGYWGDKRPDVTLESALKDWCMKWTDCNMKNFFDCRQFRFDSESKTVPEIFKLYEKGYAIVSFSKNIRKSDVLNYLKSGLKVLFMRPSEFKKMQKELEDWMVQ
jgi:hypothetical protein